MSSKRVRFITLLGSLLILVIIGISMLLTYVSKDTREFSLPESASGTTYDDSSRTTDDGLNRVSVTLDNVQDVIASLKRPDSYSRRLKIEIFSTQKTAAYELDISVLRGDEAVHAAGPGTNKNIVLAGDKLYIWYDGDKNYYEGSIGEDESLAQLADEYQMMLTYEDVLELDKNSIKDANYMDVNGENCIYVRCVSKLLNYIREYYISTESGLLIKTEEWDGVTLIYRMTASDFKSDVPEVSEFTLPDGTIPVSAP